jgi:hypothetical protein
MATTIHDLALTVPADQAWAAVADVGAIDKLITFLGPVTVTGDIRRVDMGENGTVEELIVTVDPERRRLAYSVQNSPVGFTHHHSSMQVLPDGDGSRLIWTNDFAPDELLAANSPTLDMAAGLIQKSLNG